MEKALQLVISHQSRDGATALITREAAVRCNNVAGQLIPNRRSNGALAMDGALREETKSAKRLGEYYIKVTNSCAPDAAPLSISAFDSNKVREKLYAGAGERFADPLAVPSQVVLSPENSPSFVSTAVNRRGKGTSCAIADTTSSSTNASIPWGLACSTKEIDAVTTVVSPSQINLTTGLAGSYGISTAPGVSESAVSSFMSADEDREKSKSILSSSGTVGEEKRFFGALPQTGAFVPLIEWLLRRGERRDVGTLAPAAGTLPQRSFFNEDYITKLCTAATSVLAKEPSLLELDVLTEETLVVVGDIHGQFQDLYSSVLCHQHDRHRCNLDGRDRRFLFMGDYVDRGPHSLEVVLLLLALKVEYPTLVYLTRGNHEEEKTSGAYGFLTEARTVLGADAGAAVWSAVNKVFLDLPLAAVVETPFLRFAVMHGGLSPALQSMDQIACIDRHTYNTGDLDRAAHDIVDGLLWSDPWCGATNFSTSPRGCGWNFGPAASSTFCTKNRLNFICRAHQLAMDGYFWTHDDHVVTVFSAPNYCGINDNLGAAMIIAGSANKPSFEQFEFFEEESDAPCPDAGFPYSSYFC